MAGQDEVDRGSVDQGTATAGKADGNEERGTTPGGAPGWELPRRLAGLGRDALDVGVGLGVLGLLRYRMERPRWEAELERLGFAPAAELSRMTGSLLDKGLLRLLGQA
jgi:hypothetical protein